MPILLVIVVCSNLAVAQPAVYRFITIAGDLGAGSADGTNSDARFYHPTGLAVDSAGNLFVADADNHTIRKLTPLGTNWVTSTIAGVPGHQGNTDGTNGDATFSAPSGLTFGAAGNLFLADANAAVIRELSPSGTNWVVTTIAGLPWVYGHTDGTNQDARFTSPGSVAVNRAGNLLIADNYDLRQLTLIGTNWVSSTISFFHYGFGNVIGLALGPTGALLVSGAYFVGNDGYYGILSQVNMAGTNWFNLNLPSPPDGNRGFFQITAGLDGRFFVAKENNIIWQVVPTGTNWTWSLVAGQSGVSGSTDGTNAAALFNFPFGLAADATGNLFVADLGNNTIRKLTPAGTNWVSSTIAGRAPNTAATDGTNRDAIFSGAYGIAVDADHSVYVADLASHAIRETVRVGDDWVTHTIAGMLGTPGSADGTNTDARLNQPSTLAVGGAGLLYVADTGNNTIRKLERFGTNWVTSTIAGLAGSNNPRDGTNSDIRFSSPTAIAVDPFGALFVTESGDLRKLTPIGTNWVSSTIAGEAGPVVISYPNGLAVGKNGVLYISDDAGGIGQLAPAGTNWLFTRIPVGDVFASDLAIDGAGNLLIADGEDNTIRKLVRLGTNWVSYILAGLPYSYGLQDGTNNDARFLGPSALTLDTDDNLYVTDGNRIRVGQRLGVVAPAPGIPMVSQLNGELAFTWTAIVGLAYQLQYNTNLISANWLNLGTTVTATNHLMRASDGQTVDHQRFYRITLLP